MSKIVPSQKVGIPVPPTVPADADHLTIYYGPAGFVPDYEQATQIDVPMADLGPPVKQTGIDYWQFDSTILPAVQGDSVDLYFTLADVAGNEGDFSPKVNVPLDHTPPDALGQPVILV